MKKTDDSAISSLIKWHKDEWDRRTKAVEEGTKASLEWVLPESRITMTEVLTKAEQLGIVEWSTVDFREWCYTQFDCKNMSKRRRFRPQLSGGPK
jgi:hypothetical protein